MSETPEEQQPQPEPEEQAVEEWVDPGPQALPQSVVDTAQRMVARPPVFLVAGPSTEEITYDVDQTAPVGSWFLWPEGEDPDLNQMGLVTVSPEDPRAGYAPAPE